MDFKKTNEIIRLQVIPCFVGNDLKGIIVYIKKKKKSKLVSIFKTKKVQGSELTQESGDEEK